LGSWIIELIAMFTSRSALGCQLAPPSLDFQIPPATPAVHIRCGFLSWISSARERPPMLPGPSGCQACSVPLALLAALEPDSGTSVVCAWYAPSARWTTGISATASAASSSSDTLIGCVSGDRFAQ
jgi:hypothetical protein